MQSIEITVAKYSNLGILNFINLSKYLLLKY